MAASVRAGVAYFAIVFAIGFVLGTIRVFFIIPRLGETLAVLAELPVMLMLSWIACTWLVRRFAVPTPVASRLAMGAAAFLLLMCGEFAVSVFGFGRSVPEHFAAYQTLRAQLGLAAQVLFALFPVVQLLIVRRQL